MTKIEEQARLLANLANAERHQGQLGRIRVEAVGLLLAIKKTGTCPYCGIVAETGVGPCDIRYVGQLSSMTCEMRCNTHNHTFIFERGPLPALCPMALAELGVDRKEIQSQWSPLNYFRNTQLIPI